MRLGDHVGYFITCLCDDFDLSVDTAICAQALLHRFCDFRSHSDATDLKLSALTCVLITSKINESKLPPHSQLVTFDYSFTAKHFIDREMEILLRLDFNVRQAVVSLKLKALVDELKLNRVYLRKINNGALRMLAIKYLVRSKPFADEVCCMAMVMIDCQSAMNSSNIQVAQKYLNKWGACMQDVHECVQAIYIGPSYQEGCKSPTSIREL